jgi:myosin-5
MAELDARRAYMLSNSATIIQKQTKTYFTRKTYIALRNSSIFVQSICRGQLFSFYSFPCGAHSI